MLVQGVATARLLAWAPALDVAAQGTLLVLTALDPRRFPVPQTVSNALRVDLRGAAGEYEVRDGSSSVSRRGWGVQSSSSSVVESAREVADVCADGKRDELGVLVLDDARDAVAERLNRVRGMLATRGDSVDVV